MSDDEWNRLAAQTIKSILAKRGIKYYELAKKMQDLGFEETQASIASKLSRGTFSFTFVMQIAHTLNIDYLDLRI